MKKKALEAAQEPRNEKRKAAKKDARLALLKTIRADTVGGAHPYKWKKAAEKEGWRSLPQFVQSRCSATSNDWRTRLRLPRKGRSFSGSVPLCIQRELDMLIMSIHQVCQTCRNARI